VTSNEKELAKSMIHYHRDSPMRMKSVLTVMIMISLLALSSHSIPATDVNSFSQSENISMTTLTNTTAIQYQFPTINLTRMDKSAELANFLGNRLSIDGSLKPIWSIPIRENPNYVVHSSPEKYSPFNFESWASKSTAYNSSEIKSYSHDQGVITLYYDDLDNSTNSTFLAFRAILVNSSLTASNFSSYESLVWNIVDSLGIPRDTLAVTRTGVLAYSGSVIDIPQSDFDSHYLNVFNETTVNQTCESYRIELSARIQNLDLIGSNLLSFTFNNGTHQLIRVDGSLFAGIPATTSLDVDGAISNGRILAQPELKNLPIIEADKQWEIIRDDIDGVRLVPTLVNGSNERILSLTYEYVALASIGEYHTQFWILVLIDVATGKSLFSMNMNAGIESSSSFMISIAVPGIAFFAILLVVGFVAIGPPEFSIIVLSYLVVPLLMRIKKDRILDNFYRGRIYEYIKGRPGSTFSEIKRYLNSQNGAVAYHLLVLEKLGLIRSVKEGGFRRYGIIGDKNGKSIPPHLSEIGRLVLKGLYERGPQQAPEIAKTMGISRQRLHYILKALEKHGLAESTSSGWRATIAPETDMIDDEHMK
jgi:predicted transcriptional regulator